MSNVRRENFRNNLVEAEKSSQTNKFNTIIANVVEAQHKKIAEVKKSLEEKLKNMRRITQELSDDPALFSNAFLRDKIAAISSNLSKRAKELEQHGIDLQEISKPFVTVFKLSLKQAIRDQKSTDEIDKIFETFENKLEAPNKLEQDLLKCENDFNKSVDELKSILAKVSKPITPAYRSSEEMAKIEQEKADRALKKREKDWELLKGYAKFNDDTIPESVQNAYQDAYIKTELRYVADMVKELKQLKSEHLSNDFKKDIENYDRKMKHYNMELAQNMAQEQQSALRYKALWAVIIPFNKTLIDLEANGLPLPKIEKASIEMQVTPPKAKQ